MANYNNSENMNCTYSENIPYANQTSYECRINGENLEINKNNTISNFKIQELIDNYNSSKKIDKNLELSYVNTIVFKIEGEFLVLIRNSKIIKKIKIDDLLNINHSKTNYNSVLSSQIKQNPIIVSVGAISLMTFVRNGIMDNLHGETIYKIQWGIFIASVAMLGREMNKNKKRNKFIGFFSLGLIIGLPFSECHASR